MVIELLLIFDVCHVIEDKYNNIIVLAFIKTLQEPYIVVIVFAK